MAPRILVVEDDRLIALDIERMLLKNGYQVAAVVPSAETALKMVAEKSPDLVLMDIVLAGAMDGITAAGIIREDRDIPILFLSAHSDAETLTRAKQAGSSGYILKPIRERELYVSIEMALYKRQAECRLRESAEQQHALETLFENFTEGILVVGVDGVIQRLNSGFERIFHYTREEVTGRRIDDLIIPPGQSSRFNEIISSLPHKSLFSFETVRMRKGGDLVDVSVFAFPILREKELVSLYVIYRDISEQARLQRAVIRTQRLDSIALLAGGIAHDFNNIIAAVLGNISLARMHCADQRLVARHLDRAELAAVRARDLTGQLLTFSLEGDEQAAVINLDGLLRETFEFALSGSNVTGCLDLEGGLYPVYGDEGQFSRIFNNLVINAKQAMPRGGTVTITARNLETLEPQMAGSDLPDGRYVHVTVCDDGPGIDEQALGRIFDPYFTTKESGSGLGLATVHFLVRKYHGLVTVDSQPGRGTCFSLYFPASTEVLSAGNTSDSGVAPGSGRILVMDDEEALQEVLVEILVNLGYEAVAVGNGEEALREYEAAQDSGHRFDLVIMDLTVPGGMGGREAIRELQRIDPKVLAVASSGYLHDPVMEHYELHGFCGKIAKPYRIAELSQVLLECLETPKK